MRPLLPVLLLAACSYPKSAWQEDRDAAVCTVLVDCFAAYEDASACRSAQRRDPEGPCGGYSAAKARVCLRRLAEQADECPASTLADWQIPIECADVCIYPRMDTGG